MSWNVLEGDCRDVLRSLDAGSVQACITSPPYFGLRDYGTAEWNGGDEDCDHKTFRAPRGDRPKGKLVGSTSGVDAADAGALARRECGRCGAERVDRQIGLETTPDEFVAAMVAVFREVRRVLRDDGTVWLNLGDSYSGSPRGNKGDWSTSGLNGASTSEKYQDTLNAGTATTANKANLPGVKQKDLIGIPWMVAFALRADGWFLRSDIIWAKPNPMPESVTDRPTKAHEYLFLLSKQPRYFYDADAIREEAAPASAARYDYAFGAGGKAATALDVSDNGLDRRTVPIGEREFDGMRNKRDVWTVPSAPFAGAHFATFPPKLIEPCVLAGCPEGSTVLDPFNGAGTTGLVALRHNRSYVGIELNPTYAEMARQRIRDDAPLLNTPLEVAA